MPTPISIQEITSVKIVNGASTLADFQKQVNDLISGGNQLAGGITYDVTKQQWSACIQTPVSA